MMKSKRIVLTLASLGVVLSLAAVIIYTITTLNSNALNYQYVGTPSNHYVVVSDGKKYGYITEDGKEVTSLKYDIMDSMKLDDNTINLDGFKFVDGLAQYTEDMNYGLLNEQGKEIIDADYSSIEVINKNLIIVSDNNFYFINQDNEKLFNQEFEMITSIEGLDSIFIVSSDGRQALINNKGEILTEYKYDSIYELVDSSSNNYVFCAMYGDYTDIYLYNSETLSFTKLDNFDNYTPTIFNDSNIYFVSPTGLYSIYNINTNNITTLNNNYTAIGPFVNSLAFAINSNKLVGYINEKEETVIDFQYDYNNTESFTTYGLAVVGKDNLVGVINTDNEQVLDFNYLNINIINNNRFLVLDQDNNKYIIDAKGNRITETDYDNIELTDYPNIFIVSKVSNNKTLYGIINSDGEEIIHVEYEDIKISDDYFVLKRKDNEFYIEKR